MRLAFITQDFPPEVGGIQTYSYEIAKRIHRKCEQFLVVAPATKQSSSFDSAQPFDICRVKTPNTLLGLFAIPLLLPEFSKRGIDTVFHAQWQTLPISIAAQKLGSIDYIFCAAHARELLFNPFKGYIGKIFERGRHKLLCYADNFFPVSDYTLELLRREGVPFDQCSVVINGTDPDKFFPKQVDSLKRELGLAGKKILITITRLVPRKGIDTVLKAIVLLKETFPQLHYVIAGDGYYRDKLERLTNELDLNDRVTFVGKIEYDLLNDYYNLGDIFIMTSKTEPPDIEGFGIVFLEAAACAKPVIGSTSGGIPSAVIDNKTGLLVEENNPERLAISIKKLLNDSSLAKNLGMEGRKHVLAEANWEAVTERLYQLMQNKKSSKYSFLN